MSVRWKGSHGPSLCMLATLLTLAQASATGATARAAWASPREPAAHHTLMPVPASVRILGGRMKVEQTFSSCATRSLWQETHRS